MCVGNHERTQRGHIIQHLLDAQFGKGDIGVIEGGDGQTVIIVDTGNSPHGSYEWWQSYGGKPDDDCLLVQWLPASDFPEVALPPDDELKTFPKTLHSWEARYLQGSKEYFAEPTVRAHFLREIGQYRKRREKIIADFAAAEAAKSAGSTKNT